MVDIIETQNASEVQSDSDTTAPTADELDRLWLDLRRHEADEAERRYIKLMQKALALEPADGSAD